MEEEERVEREMEGEEEEEKEEKGEKGKVGGGGDQENPSVYVYYKLPSPHTLTLHTTHHVDA